MTEIDINLIKDKTYDIKESCPKKTAMVRRSLLKYGQLKPVIVFKDKDDMFQLITGSTLLAQMRELEYKTVWALDIGERTLLQQVDICNSLDQSVRDVHVLKFANLIDEKMTGHADEGIAIELGIGLMQVKVLRDILKLKWNYEQQKDNTQQILFSDENS